jgi:Uma2 family endonuclease
MPVQVLRRHFTIDDYYRMAQAGILHEDDRVELIDGEIVEIAPIGSRHAACVIGLIEFLSQQAGPEKPLSKPLPWVTKLR